MLVMIIMIIVIMISFICRFIMNSLVQSENNYLDSLSRLVSSLINFVIIIIINFFIKIWFIITTNTIVTLVYPHQVNDYKKPLEESNPPILPEAKVETMFYRCCHPNC